MTKITGGREEIFSYLDLSARLVTSLIAAVSY